MQKHSFLNVIRPDCMQLLVWMKRYQKLYFIKRCLGGTTLFGKSLGLLIVPQLISSSNVKGLENWLYY